MQTVSMTHTKEREMAQGSIDIAAELEALLKRDPDLLNRLRSAAGKDQATKLITEAAERHGMKLGGHDVAGLIQQAGRQAKVFVTVQKLVQNDPSLEPALRQAERAEDAMGLLKAAAERQGVTLDVENLGELMQFASKDAANQELDDEQLAAVAGGVGMWIAPPGFRNKGLRDLLSLFGVGIGEASEHSF